MRVYEGISAYSIGPHKIRVWRGKDTLRGSDECLDIYDMLSRFGEFDSPEDIAEAIAVLPRVNAVEVTDWNGRGVLIYPDWP